MRHSLLSSMLAIASMASILASPASAEESRLILDGKVFLDPALPDCGLQKAIDTAAAAPAGGTVVLPEGEFVLRRSLYMRNKVDLTGQGPDKTVLRSAFTNRWIKIAGIASNRVTLATMPADLKPGATVHLWPRKPTDGWLGYYDPQLVTAVDGLTLTVDGIKLRPIAPSETATAWLEYGLCAVLTAPVEAPASELHVADASIFSLGQAVAVGSGDGNENQSLSFIRAISNNTLFLERPIRMSAKPEDSGIWRRPAVWNLFPLLTCEGAGPFAVSNLTLRGSIPADARPKLTRYTLSLAHFSYASNAVVENVVFENSAADGFSIQSGTRVTARNCVARGSRGNGFHPGTGLTDSVFENLLAEDNGTGFYFCWHNKRHLIRNCRFVRNKGGGITGLGNPSDRFNTIEDCTISENGGPGIAINGGGIASNTIRNCVIENNSRDQPGKSPGIALYAAVEDARCILIESNVVRDTQAEPTQWVGIEEKNGERQGKPTAADQNIIRGNRCAGHRSADIVVAGTNTVVEHNENAVIKRPAAPVVKPGQTP